MRRGFRLFAAAAGTFGAATALAMAAPSNGNFETGNFDGWERFDESSDSRAISKGRWQVYKGKLKYGELEGPRRGLGLDLKLPEPPQGKYAAAIASEGPGTHILHRVISVSGDQKLSLQLAYWNSAEDFYTPDTLSSIEPGRRGGMGDFQNQQLRIDLMAPDAEIGSLANEDIVKTVFRTQPGDDLRRAYKKVAANVDEGEYRLRIAEVDNQLNFMVGVDAVKLKDR